MTVVVTPETERRRKERWLGELGFALDWRLKKLQSDYLQGSPAARAHLAQLRRGLGKTAGDVPEIWHLTIGAVPEKLAGRSDVPSNAERAAHAALTLYALHQQSRGAPMHVSGVSFGTAVSALRDAGGPSAEAVTKRFLAVSTAQSIDEVLIHIRGLIGQLKAHGVGLDYAQLADDLLRLLTPRDQTGARLQWGRDFYRSTSMEKDTVNKRSKTSPVDNSQGEEEL